MPPIAPFGWRVRTNSPFSSSSWRRGDSLSAEETASMPCPFGEASRHRNSTVSGPSSAIGCHKGHYRFESISSLVKSSADFRRPAGWKGFSPEGLSTDEAQNTRDIFARFGIRRYTPEPLDGRFACVVRRQGQPFGESIEQRSEVPDAALDVGLRIVRVRHVETARGVRHELHQPHG